MAAIATPPITVEQFLRFQSPRGFRSELINGEIILSPDPQAPHYDICERIYEFLKQICPEPTYKVLQRINLRLESADQMPSPDVMVIEYQAWSKAQRDGYPRTTPFLVVEVISPSNRKRSITAKVQRYLESGVPTVWVVHPKKRIVNVYDGNKTAVLTEADILRVPPTLAIGAFSVRQLFSFAEKITSL